MLDDQFVFRLFRHLSSGQEATKSVSTRKIENHDDPKVFASNYHDILLAHRLCSGITNNE
jgi:hypothetical protein